MKRSYKILTLLALVLFSFNVNAQNNLCNIVDVEVVIENIIWDATDAELNALLNQNPSGFGFGQTYVSVPHPTFHIVKIDFERPDGYLQANARLTFDIDVNVSTAHYESDVPVYLIFDDAINSGVRALTDSHGNITGFRIIPEGLGGGGLSTTATVMGRSAEYEPSHNWDCIEIVATNRKGTTNSGQCYLDDAIYSECFASVEASNQIGWKVDMSNSPSVNVYPNPVQDNLFIENNGLEISEISIMTLDGKVVNHKTSIRQGIDRTQINTSGLDTGIYLLKLETSTESIIQKIIIR